ncbi:unnamed protein product [Cunninghamella echinulata]
MTGGIFEPFLEPTKKEDTTVSIDLTNLSLKDILPPDDQLELMIKNKQVKSTIPVQKQIIQLVLDSLQNNTPINKNQLLKLVNNDKSELTALGNMILRISQVGAPLALKLYEQAMVLEDDQGAFSYANMIYRGYRGTIKNEGLGIKLMSELARKGHPYAQMNLGSIIMRQEPDRVQQAIQLYELAGKNGIGQAYLELGRMYRLGYGVHQDHQMAISYFQKGSQLNHPQCHFMLGVYASSGLGNTSKEPDQAKAFKYFQKAAMKGLPEAQYNVGLRFLKGHGCEPNMFNAAEFMKMAATQGFQLAQANLANMYLEGRGLEKDIDQARLWFEKAIAKGGTIGKEAQKQLQSLDDKKNNSKCILM